MQITPLYTARLAIRTSQQVDFSRQNFSGKKEVDKAGSLPASLSQFFLPSDLCPKINHGYSFDDFSRNFKFNIVKTGHERAGV